MNQLTFTNVHLSSTLLAEFPNRLQRRSGVLYVKKHSSALESPNLSPAFPLYFWDLGQFTSTWNLSCAEVSNFSRYMPSCEYKCIYLRFSTIQLPWAPMSQDSRNLTSVNVGNLTHIRDSLSLQDPSHFSPEMSLSPQDLWNTWNGREPWLINTTYPLILICSLVLSSLVSIKAPYSVLRLV